MKRRTFLVAPAGILAAPLVAEAQQSGKVLNIGWPGTGGPGVAVVDEARPEDADG